LKCKTLGSAQLRAARALVRWDQSTVAEAAGVSIETIKRLERMDGPLGSVRVNTIDAIRRALEAAGVIWTPPRTLI
jgi:transcriptional regulator with XRE-family HTH domain